MASSTARMYHSIAEELGCAPELVGVVAKELKLRKKNDIRHAVTERLSTQAEPQSDSTPTDDAPPVKKEKKAGLTLSQRRALLKLLDAGDAGVSPATAFKSLPYEKLVEVGYAADQSDGDEERGPIYVLTQSGRTRAESINPGYRIWSAGETVAGDESRPVAGTKRAAKADEADVAVDDGTDTEDEGEDAESEASDEPVAIEA